MIEMQDLFSNEIKALPFHARMIIALAALLGAIFHRRIFDFTIQRLSRKRRYKQRYLYTDEFFVYMRELLATGGIIDRMQFDGESRNTIYRLVVRTLVQAKLEVLEKFLRETDLKKVCNIEFTGRLKAALYECEATFYRSLKGRLHPKIYQLIIEDESKGLAPLLKDEFQFLIPIVDKIIANELLFDNPLEKMVMVIKQSHVHLTLCIGKVEHVCSSVNGDLSWLLMELQKSNQPITR